MNKVTHGVVLVFFAICCWFLWGFLRMCRGVPIGDGPLPAFTQLCLDVGPTVLIGLIVAAALYCVVVWMRKTDGRTPWIGFFAATTGTLALITLPILIAAYLPVLLALQQNQ